MSLFTSIRQSCRGWPALLYLAILGYFAYVGYRQYLDPLGYNSWFAPLNLCIHEGGHLLMRQLGNELLHVAGGTALQLAAPIISMFILLRHGEAFGIPFCLGWLSTNLIGVGVYMADARACELPLVTAEGGDGSDTIRDWTWLFGHFGLLHLDTTIGYWTRALGSATMVLALLVGVLMLLLAAFPPRYVSPETKRQDAADRKHQRRVP